MRKSRPRKCGLRNYEKFKICQTTISPLFSVRIAERAKFVSAPCENRRMRGKAKTRVNFLAGGGDFHVCPRISLPELSLWKIRNYSLRIFLTKERTLFSARCCLLS